MIKNIAHLSDIHIANKSNLHPYIKESLENTILSLKNTKPDRIVIVGDLFHDFTKPTNEVKAMAGWFLRECSKIAKTIITQGNHDCNIKSPDKLDSVKTVVDILNDPNIYYYNETGFYEDDNVVYAVWHHLDKMSPWVKFPDYQRLENKTYIDLFHDPINTSKTFFGVEFNEEKYVGLDDFKGDLLLMGDIHQRQFFNKNGKLFGAYPSSLFQNDFGESIDKHGYLIWDISGDNFTVIEYETENSFSYVNYHIKQGFEYNNLEIKIDTKEKTHLKIHWNDLTSNITSENERLIRSYIKENYPNVIELKFSKDRIKSNKIEEDDYIKKNIKNVYDTNVQQEIFRNFLKDKGYSQDVIDEVISLDDIITKRLQLTSKENSSYDWELVSFYLDNYRSHGKKTKINWKHKNGVWQIKGQNGKGKTNLLSSICYLFYGKTLETLKKESNGDNRFINNKRDENYCEVGGVLKINGEYFKLIRRTERHLDKTKTKITKTPTTFTIYKLDENFSEITNETDNEKNETQKIVTNSIGTFEDFLRTSLVNGDTLNNLISLDESVFMDTILRDSGLDIFELKLGEYKEYKKEEYKKEAKIVLNVDDKQSEINDLKVSIENDNLSIVNIENDIKNTEDRIKKGNSMRDTELLKLIPIDETLKNLNIDAVKTDIDKLSTDRLTKTREKESLTEQIEQITEIFDEPKYKNLTEEKDRLKTLSYELKNKIKSLNNDIDNVKQKNGIINGEIFNFKKEIQSLINLNEKEKINLKDKISNKEREIQNIIKSIDNQISNIQKEITILEQSKICPSCKRELDSDSIKNIQETIKTKENDILSFEKSKTVNPDIFKIQEEIKTIESEITNGNETIKNNLKEITNIETKIKEKDANIISNNQIIIGYEADIERINSEITQNEVSLSDVNEKIIELDIIKDKIEQKNKLMLIRDNIPTIIENIDLKINNHKETIVKYENNISNIKENEKIQKNIDTYNTLLEKLNNEIKNLNNQITTIINGDIKIKEQKIKDITQAIEKYKKQERKELVNAVYQECIHRDGLPKLMLLKIRDDINIEIMNLLSEMDFSVYFDEDMTLKMYNNVNPNAIINVIGGCGMERTFISVILRIALRNINNKSVGNVLFLDEITGKLLDDSVIKFFDLVHKMKQTIQKIVIIEHAYSNDLNPDHIIEVTASEQGISTITLND